VMWKTSGLFKGGVRFVWLFGLSGVGFFVFGGLSRSGGCGWGGGVLLVCCLGWGQRSIVGSHKGIKDGVGGDGKVII
jgi:hypothetical protein